MRGGGAPGLSRTEAAYAALKASILDGSIGRADAIDEQAVAQRLGMSRTPVREALLRLRAEGLVEMSRGRGIHLRLLSPADMREIYEVITGLETLAVHLLAERRPDATMLAPLAAAEAAMASAEASGDVEAWGRGDERFHRALLELCGNTRAHASGIEWRNIAQRAHLVAMRLQPVEYLRGSARAHRELIEAIASHDAEGAGLLHFRQRRRGERALLDAIGRYRLSAL